MTILNVWIGPDTALVGVDSAGLDRGGTLRDDVSKMFFLPAVGCVLAARGDTYIVNQLHTLLNGKGDYDAVAAALPGKVKNLVRWAFFLQSPNQEVVLVGYSVKLQRMACTSVYLTKKPRAMVVEDRREYAGPWDDCLESLPKADNPQAMFNLAQAQLQLLREKMPGGAAGGRFVIAELNKAGMQIWCGKKMGGDYGR